MQGKRLLERVLAHVDNVPPGSKKVKVVEGNADMENQAEQRHALLPKVSALNETENRHLLLAELQGSGG